MIGFTRKEGERGESGSFIRGERRGKRRGVCQGTEEGGLWVIGVVFGGKSAPGIREEERKGEIPVEG